MSRGKTTMLGVLKALFGSAFVTEVPTGGGAPQRLSQADPNFQDKCLRLFDFGLDTRDIALQLGERECVVASALSVARERRLEG